MGRKERTLIGEERMGRWPPMLLAPEKSGRAVDAKFTTVYYCMTGGICMLSESSKE